MARWVLFLAALFIGMWPARAGETAATDFQVRAFTLSSGLHVIIAKAPQVPERTPRAYVGLYVGSGWVEETALGEAHFIEHVVANAPMSATVPALPATGQTLAANAVTKPNYTVFVRTVSPEGLEAAVRSRLARIGNVVADPQVFDREKIRVTDELAKTRPPYAAYKILDAYARHRPPALDTEIATVRATSLTGLWIAVRRAYVPARATLVVAGDVDPDRTADIVRHSADLLGLARPSATKLPLPVAPIDLRQPPLVIARNDASDDYVAALGFQPRRNGRDALTLLVLDQLLLADPAGKPDAEGVAHSDLSPFAIRLAARTGSSQVSDAKDSRWGAPLFADGDPAFYSIVFHLPAAVAPGTISSAVTATLRDIRRNGASDAAIGAAKQRLAAYYPRWFLEPDFRIVSDHLAALEMSGQDPATLNDLPRGIAAVDPNMVRRMLDRMIAAPRLLVVVTPKITKAS
jgi:predicted Zn-dependent peptidase